MFRRQSKKTYNISNPHSEWPPKWISAIWNDIIDLVAPSGFSLCRCTLRCTMRACGFEYAMTLRVIWDPLLMDGWMDGWNVLDVGTRKWSGAFDAIECLWFFEPQMAYLKFDRKKQIKGDLYVFACVWRWSEYERIVLILSGLKCIICWLHLN